MSNVQDNQIVITENDLIIKEWIDKNPGSINSITTASKKIFAEGNVSMTARQIAKRIPEIIKHFSFLESTEYLDNVNSLTISHETLVKKVDEEFDGNISLAAREMRIPRSTLQRWYDKPIKRSKNVNRYIITYAQNDTIVHTGFLAAIKNYATKWNAELICFKGKYRNPTNAIEYEKDNPVWDESIRPYLLDSKLQLNDNLILYPARNRPTTAHPLTGYDTHTGHCSGIFPHPKIRLRTVPTPGHAMPKILTTTGAITVANYSKSAAGDKGDNTHVIGAAIVEIKNNKVFHIRHIQAEEDGSFYDIAGGQCLKYTPTGILSEENGKKIALDTITFGDIHGEWVDKVALAGGLDAVNRFNAKRLVLHDLTDFWRVNHHEINNRFLNSAKYEESLISVKEEIRHTAELLKSMSNPEKYETLVVTSNHDEALDRWLNEAKLETLGPNAEYFHYLSYHKHKSRTRTAVGFRFANMLEFAISEFIDLKENNIRFLEVDKPEIHLGIDYSQHGHYGPNGARGSVMNLSKIGIPCTIGHAHSPAIEGDCYQVGVKCLHLGYAKGPSGWLSTDCFTYSNGKRTLITYIDGEYYLDDSK